MYFTLLIFVTFASFTFSKFYFCVTFTSFSKFYQLCWKGTIVETVFLIKVLSSPLNVLYCCYMHGQGMSYVPHQFNLTFLREIIDTRDMLSMCMTLTKMLL